MLPNKVFSNRPRKKVRLLVVGDDDATGEDDYYSQLKEIVDLSSHIYEISYQLTKSGKEAMQLINTWQPNVILVDAFLHDVNSSEVVKAGSSHEVPVVVASNFPNTEIEESSITYGASAYISKSSAPEDVEFALACIADIAADISFEKH
jgi:DNA-binding NarL/FixJ family response regulator